MIKLDRTHYTSLELPTLILLQQEHLFLAQKFFSFPTSFSDSNLMLYERLHISHMLLKRVHISKSEVQSETGLHHI